jgi:hypothetical protein
MHLLLVSFHFLAALIGGWATPAETQDKMPKVFIIGNQPALEAVLNEEYNYSIVSVFNENPQTAFTEWATMLLRMDDQCVQNPELDIRGIKAFATFYWSRTGELKYVGYALKSNSRYVKQEEMERYFLRFMANFRMPVPRQNQNKFLHSFTLTLPYPRELSTSRPVFSHSN